MALNNFKCNYLIPVHFKGLRIALTRWYLMKKWVKCFRFHGRR